MKIMKWIYFIIGSYDYYRNIDNIFFVELAINDNGNDYNRWLLNDINYNLMNAAWKWENKFNQSWCIVFIFNVL